MSAAFGNDSAKIEKYRAFWDRRPVGRPLIGFSLVGWFPLQYFGACKSWQVDDHITPEMIDPSAWLDDQERLLAEGDMIDDDMIRGACPTQVAFPVFLPAMFGSRIRVLPDNVIGEEMHLGWDEALAIRYDSDSPWLLKYLEFARELAKKAGGRYPVSHGAEQGPTDLHAVLRGHNQSLIDLLDEPAKTSELLMNLGEIFSTFTAAVWEEIPLYHDGFFDAQYQLWAPGPIVRMQEDATAVYSPALYRELVQPVDRMIARRFANCFMHLHTTSMFLLDEFLGIEELRCLEINIEPFNLTVAEMVPYYKRVQAADRSLLVRGSVTPDELTLLLETLDPRGLYLHIVVESVEEALALRRTAGM